MQKIWELKTENIPTNIDQAIKFLLHNRNIDSIESFVNIEPPTDFIKKHEPFITLQKNVDLAKKLIEETIEKNQPIIIHGDYDADGQTATAILFRTLMNDLKYKNVYYYIPNRFDEGYGLSDESLLGMKALLESENFEIKDSLIITVDCGIVSQKEAIRAKELGFKIIISDHHQPAEKLPEPDVLVWTDKATGAGIAWIIANSLTNQGKYSDLAAIGTICDLQPLTEFNRSITKQGLDVIQNTEITGIKSLANAADIKGKIEEYHIGWVIGPRLNATGRLESAVESLKLLITDDRAEANQLAENLNAINTQRQDKTKVDLETAILEYKGITPLPPFLISYNETFHEGVIGLVAGKLVQTYYRPAIALTSEPDSEFAKGSARSIEGISIVDVLRRYEDLFEKMGGHDMAAGFSIKLSNIMELKSTLQSLNEWPEEIFTPKVKIEFELPSSLINLEFYNTIQKLRPFGTGNPEPVFITSHLEIANLMFFGKENNHLKLFLTDSQSKKITAIYFGAIEKENIRKLEIGSEVQVAYNLTLNEWNGFKNIELKVKDIQSDRNPHIHYDVYMKRTQIYLTEVQMKTIEQIAKRENKTLSEVIRDSIDLRIDTVSDQPNPLLQDTIEHVKKYKGKFKMGKHASRDHDKILYGK